MMLPHDLPPFAASDARQSVDLLDLCPMLRLGAVKR